MSGLEHIEKVDRHTLELGQHDRKILQEFAAAQLFDVMDDGLNAQYPLAFVVDLQSQAPEVQFEYSNIMDGAIDDALHTHRSG